MDSSSSSSQNWLSFSLSNHQPSLHSSNICLFEAFNTNHGKAERGLGVQESGSSCTDLPMLCAGPKLEDFLGGGGRFSAGVPAPDSDASIYDSELKTIAAGIFGGFPADGAKPPGAVESASKKAVDTFGQRTSIYRGVTRHRWTGRYEAHLWDNSCRREGQSRKGRQVYLGGYDKEEKAARAYDLAALKYWGPTTTTNFPVSSYEKELEEMKNMTRQEFVASLRRKSSGFSRGASIYRGVTRHHQHGRWQARIGRVAGNKDLYLGTFSTQEEAAEAYDIAAIKFRGLNAVTNFDMSRYDVKSIINSNLPIGGMSGKSRQSDSSSSDSKSSESKQTDLSIASQPSTTTITTLTFAQPIKSDLQDYWSLLALQGPPQINAKPNPTLLQSSANCNMDFPSPLSVNPSNGSFPCGGGIFQQQTACLSLPFAAPVSTTAAAATAGAETSNSFESSSYGSWASTSMHGFQPAKPNLAILQTPIFGME